MRKVERIPVIIAKLQAAWEKVPDWRLGQLISNLIGTGPQDVFFPEDEEWEKWLDDFNGKKQEST